MEKVVIPYGKYKGKTLDEVPASYLMMLLEPDDFKKKLVEYLASDRFRERLLAGLPTKVDVKEPLAKEPLAKEPLAKEPLGDLPLGSKVKIKNRVYIVNIHSEGQVFLSGKKTVCTFNSGYTDYKLIQRGLE